MTIFCYLIYPQQSLLRVLPEFGLDEEWMVKPHLFSIDTTYIEGFENQAELIVFIKIAFLLKMLSYASMDKAKSDTDPTRFDNLLFSAKRPVNIEDFDKWWELESVAEEHNNLEILLASQRRHVEMLVHNNEPEIDLLIDVKRREEQGDIRVQEIWKEHLTYIMPSPAFFIVRPKQNLLQLLKPYSDTALDKSQIWKRMVSEHPRVYIHSYVQVIKITFMLYIAILSEQDAVILNVAKHVFGKELNLTIETFNQWWDVEYLYNSPDSFSKRLEMTHINILNQLSRTGIQFVDNWMDSFKVKYHIEHLKNNS